MNKIAIAEELLKERAEHTTDATAFRVNVHKDKKGRKERITLTPDSDRRGGNDGTFYHMDTVVKVCEPLHLNYWISSMVYYDETVQYYRATFEVHIY